MHSRAIIVGSLFLNGLFAQTASSTSDADVAAGAKTFRSHCAECHGLNGEGGRGPNLALGVFYHGSSDTELLNNISNGIPGTEMPALFYSLDRVVQVVAYLRSLNRASAVPTKGNLQAGEALYRSSGCSQCHRIQADGGRLGPDLAGIGATRSAAHLRQAVLEPNADVRQRYWLVQFTRDDGKAIKGFLLNEDTYTVQLIDFDSKLESYAKSGLKNYQVEKTSMMPSYQGKLRSEQVDDLVAYLASLRPPGGAR